MGDDHSSLASSQLSDVSSTAAVNRNAAVSAKLELRFLEDSDLDLSLSISNKRNKKVGSSSKAKHHLEPRVYACDFCKKKFPTCQALGGHQNGHKMEREMMKQRRLLGQDNKQQHYNPTLLNYKLSAMHHNTFITSPSYLRSNTNILNTMSSTARRCDLSRNLIDSFRGGYDVEEKPGAADDPNYPSDLSGLDLNLKL